jgi:AraC-like DNA-binding protein
MQGARLNSVDVLRMRGTIHRVKWTTPCRNQRSEFILSLNRTPMLLSQLHRDAELPAGAATLFSFAESGDIRCQEYHDLSMIVVSRARLQELVANIEDLVARPVQDSAALRHLRRYAEIVHGPDDVNADPGLTNHIARTLTDLVVLALGAGGDAAELARNRGLRAARQQAIIAAIRANFSDPAFSSQALASRLGVSARYVQRLLYETGSTFGERVLELRLQRARAMLADARCDRLKVGEIAEACGFNDIAHFDRCFRRRFGGTPTQYRGRSW